LEIELKDIGKKFAKRWLFRHISFKVHTHQMIALTGHNGSGKSTLLQLIFGYQVPTEGSVSLSSNGNMMNEADRFRHMSFVAPYLELPEELSMMELLHYHFSFKQLRPGYSYEELIAQAGLAGNEDKHIRYFSSGMKQRLKLLLAFNDTAPVLLLDEPTSNLDENGIQWYRQQLSEQRQHRTILIASNQPYEYEGCDAVLDVTAFVSSR
jgi:ABC-type multidrug transport system ATPase subunit